MKKLIISAIALTVASFATVSATTFLPASAIVYSQQQQEKVEVAPKDLPEAVRTALTSDTYTGWEISKAYQVTGENNNRYYQIDLTKGEETMSVNLDAEGQKIE